MNPNRKAFYPDVVVGYVCLIIAVWCFGYLYGKHIGEQTPMVCAKVLGMQVAHSTADECTYIMGTQGRAYWKLLAKREEKK